MDSRSLTSEADSGAKQGRMSLDTSAAEAALRAKLSRKRTKTGCLTCRKRRIKCDEVKPVCRNCVKSKRLCEGYSQRTILRQPDFDYRTVPHGGAHITFQIGPQAGPAIPYTTHQQYPPDATYPTPIRPNHTGVYAPTNFQSQVQHAQGSEFSRPAFPQYSSAAGPQIFSMSHAGIPDPSAVQFPHHLPQFADARTAYAHEAFPTPISDSVPSEHYLPTTGHADPPSQPHYERLLARNAPAIIANDQRASPVSSRSSRSLASNSSPTTGRSSITWAAESYVPRPELLRPIDSHTPPPVSLSDASTAMPLHIYHPGLQQATTDGHNHSTGAAGAIDIQQPSPLYNGVTVSDFLSAAAIETQDDDYYDVEPDEEMELDTLTLSTHDDRRRRAFLRMVQDGQIPPRDLQTRGYDTFIYGGILDHYRVDEVANPLKNQATARVFMHFVAVTGPSLSLFERHPQNTSILFNDGQLPLSQRGLWTYTMPMAALTNQGLLHCMLALASFHIAKIQNASVTPSIQHYAWALKRVHHCVGHPKKRLKHTTIAASLLLGYYEIMAAEHMKWNTHLAGSKQLFTETDFVGMTRQFRQMKRDRASRQRTGAPSPLSQVEDEMLDQIYDIDEDKVSDLVGKQVSYETHGHVILQDTSLPPVLDLSKYEVLKDLWWWYCKQDAYQSIVSGNALLLNFSRWPSCPPRAPIGHSGAVLGSFDHLILLLGRIADFAYRDRSRKLLQMDANGGQWRPAPGMKMPGKQPQTAPLTPVSSQDPPSKPPHAPASAAQTPAQPMFYGMAPSSANAPMPSSYHPVHGIPTPQTASPKDAIDLAAATQASLEEYGRIRSALHTFSQNLGEGFHPLTSDEHQPLNTPFGRALFYRSYDIACLWSIYYMTLIVAIRSHPHMHPAAHVAAALCAQETSFFANEIGRIAAGIVPSPESEPLNPTVGASLCESCMPSFFAAVQYQNTRQRHETVLRIFNIARRTGWGTAELIANGCETAWVKSAAAGRGPPYERILRSMFESSDDPRLNGRWERLDPETWPTERDERDRRLVKIAPSARLNWAIGIMGTEDDEKMQEGQGDVI